MKARNWIHPRRYRRRLRECYDHLLRETFAQRVAVLSMLSRKRPARYIKTILQGEDPCSESSRAAVFSHYDPYGNIADYVVRYMRELVVEGLRTHFVDNSPASRSEEIEKVRPYVREVLQRKNVGFDFGAFKDVILRIEDLSALDGLLIANDSVYGPFVPLRSIFERASSLQADFWAPTDNWERKYHLQSYFVYFEKDVLSSGTFLDFFRRCVYPLTKGVLVMYCEILLTQQLTRAGFRSAALFDYRQLAAQAMTHMNRADNLERSILQAVEAAVPLNPTHYFWNLLIEAGFPFLKRDILMKNPPEIANKMSWESVIREHSDFDCDLIVDHLKPFLKNRCV